MGKLLGNLLCGDPAGYPSPNNGVPMPLALEDPVSTTIPHHWYRCESNPPDVVRHPQKDNLAQSWKVKEKPSHT